MPSADEKSRFLAAHASLETIAVTGTNGKTTVTSMVDSIVAATGQPSARLTTLGSFVDGQRVDVGDSSTEFLRTVELAVKSKVRFFALEVTSKALMTGWGQKWPAHVAVFTNISRDHMDMHASPEAYLAAKAQLFISVPANAHCVLNACDPYSDFIAETIPDHAQVHYYAADKPALSQKPTLAASEIRCSRSGLDIQLIDSSLARELGGSLQLPIVGEVHAHNALAAALAAHLAGIDAKAIVRGLANFQGVPGRFEIVATKPLTVVDYAHTPDGLRGTLETARQLVGDGGELHAVFGCGGERDPGKRPQMGKVAQEHADRVTITNDNPRRECAKSIAAEILTGAPEAAKSWRLCLDRPKAIEAALREAKDSDVVVIAGKGHESFQEIAGQKLPMSDVTLAKAALQRRH